MFYSTAPTRIFVEVPPTYDNKIIKTTLESVDKREVNNSQFTIIGALGTGERNVTH
jgi:hypothetical protein